MLKIDFVFSDKWNENVDPVALGQMSEIDLRYGSAFGDLILIANEVDCSAKWGWIPMIDLTVALRHIFESLAKNPVGIEVFEFTESDATITVEREHDMVRLKTSYAPCSECVLFSEFETAVQQFCNKVFRDAATRFPTLKQNSAFQLLEKQSVLL